MAIKPKSQLEKRIDGLKAGGVGKNVGNASEIFNNYSGSYANVIDGAYSAHAEGLQNTISSGSLGSHAEGVENSISNSAGSHVEGDFNHISSSDYSHAEGESSKIFDSKWAHAGGYGCYIMSHADCGFAHGYGAKVTGAAATAFGSQTLAAGKNQFVAGKGNIEDSENKYALIIGNGTEVPRGQTSFEASNALTLDWEGNLWVAGKIEAQGGGAATYTAGAGIDISKSSESSEISAKIDSKTIQFDADGKMYVPTVPLTLENAVVIQEADAKYLLHEYTQVEYIAGNKIGYAGAQNQIIAQGYIIYKNGGTAPNGVTITNTAVSDPSGLPDIPMYTDMPFSGSAYYNNTVKTVRAYMKLASSSSSSDNYSILFTLEDGTEKIVANNIYNHDNFQYGLSFAWTGIYPPGYTVSGVTHPYGAVQAQAYYKAKVTQTGTAAYRFQPSGGLMIDFASEAEYNAAVGLTYEPNTLTQVNETVTEV